MRDIFSTFLIQKIHGSDFLKMPDIKQISRPGMGFGFLPWSLKKYERW